MMKYDATSFLHVSETNAMAADVFFHHTFFKICWLSSQSPFSRPFKCQSPFSKPSSCSQSHFSRPCKNYSRLFDAIFHNTCPGLFRHFLWHLLCWHWLGELGFSLWLGCLWLGFPFWLCTSHPPIIVITFVAITFVAITAAPSVRGALSVVAV